jgi:hypothetical protein
MAFLNGTDPGLRQTRTPTVDTFAAGVGFTAGSSTYVTLSVDCGTEASLTTTFDGITQHRDTYSYDTSNRRVTFDAAIPTGVSKIECTYTTTIPATTPTDGSVTQAKLGDQAVNEAKLQVSNAPTNGYFLSAQSGNTGGLTWAEAGGGKLLQIVHGSASSVATTTTQLPNDNTKPQNTEGAEVVTVAITPANSSNKLFITSNIQMTKDTGTQAGYIALFQDSTADALACAWATSDTANNGNSHSLTHVMTAGTTSATTFKMRGGNTNTGTVTFNGESGNAKLNGTLFSTITIMEIEA